MHRKYTFGKPEGRRSAIDHIVVNTKMNENFKAMRIDENCEEINISDHNLIRSWYKIGRINGTDWKKPSMEVRKWYTLEPEALGRMEKEIERRLRGPISFRGMMGIIAIAQEIHLKKTRRIQIGVKEEKPILSAPWMD